MKVNIHRMEGYSDEYFIVGGRRWLMANLIAMSKDLEVFDLPLIGLDLLVSPWECASVASFIYHVQRVQDCDLKHPVILGAEGQLMNGWHRICKAILQGDETIKAVRFETTPGADIVEGSE